MQAGLGLENMSQCSQDPRRSSRISRSKRCRSQVTAKLSESRINSTTSCMIMAPFLVCDPTFYEPLLLEVSRQRRRPFVSHRIGTYPFGYGDSFAATQVIDSRQMAFLGDLKRSIPRYQARCIAYVHTSPTVIARNASEAHAALNVIVSVQASKTLQPTSRKPHPGHQDP